MISITIGSLICLWQLYELNSTNHFTFWIIGFVPLPVIALGLILVVAGLWDIVGLRFLPIAAKIELLSLSIFAVMAIVPFAILGLVFANSTLPVRIGITCGVVAAISLMGWIATGTKDWTEHEHQKLSFAGCGIIIAVLLGLIGAIIAGVVMLFLS